LSELMRRAQDGDRNAYDALLREVARMVRGFARKRLREQEVEDVVQETLLSIHDRRHTFDPARPFGPWMYAIARHRVVDAVRKREQRAAREILGDLELAEFSAHADASMPSGWLTLAFAQLSEAQREVIQLLKVEGYTVSEISDRTGRSESLVKITAHRGYNVLRRWMAHAFYDE
jgi:RNA polymerase sigma factor (sigma-70 family)